MRWLASSMSLKTCRSIQDRSEGVGDLGAPHGQYAGHLNYKAKVRQLVIFHQLTEDMQVSTRLQ